MALLATQYGLRRFDMFPFTVEQFLNVFERYNVSVFPMQAVAYVLGLIAVYLAFRNRAGRIVPAILSFLWLWNGIAYHLLFFSPINKAAYGFGVLFVVQGLLFAWTGVFQKGLSFRYPQSGLFSTLGFMAIAYSMAVYPALGMLLGHTYPRAPMFGIAPCPTTIFTFGLLLWTAPRLPRYILTIHLFWSIIGFGAAMNFGIHEDIGLLITGVLAATVLLYREKRTKKAGYAADQGRLATI
jgi:hypothetical protein